MKKVADVVDLLQALADGKMLEVRMDGVGDWKDSCHNEKVSLPVLLADFGRHQYRIKRTPREIFIHEYVDGSLRLPADPPIGNFSTVGKVKFREVLDEE